MILSRLSNYLRERRRASLVEMAYGLDSTPEALVPMLATLERKLLRQIGYGDGVANGDFTHHRRGRTFEGMTAATAARCFIATAALRCTRTARAVVGLTER